MTRAVSRAAALLAAVSGGLLLLAVPAAAHPLGNFSVNTYSAVAVEPSAVRVDVVVDWAEIPTQQRFADLDESAAALVESAAGQECAAVAAGATLTAAGRPLPLRTTTATLAFPPGAAGLPTARLTCALRTSDSPDLVGTELGYALRPVSDGVGWREVTATGDGVSLTGSDVPEESISDALRSYPEDLLSSPLDVRAASFEVTDGTGLATGIGSVIDTGPVSALPRGADRFTEAFTALVARDRLTVPFGLFAVGVAALLGALHAFAPGHGKTVMAAYLLGRRGSLRDAVVVGASVTATHTLGVLALGLTLTAVGLASPERLYPWLGLTSGLLLVGIGVALLRSARARSSAAVPSAVPTRVPEPVPVLAGAHGGHGAVHDDNHDHPHDDHPHDDHHGLQPHSHGLTTHTHALPPPGSGVRGLMAVGFAGGLVPSPSALVVLLGGIALGRAWFGLGLVVAYGVGMAAALVATGLLLVRGRDRLTALLQRSERSGRLATLRRLAGALPTVTASLVVVVGVGLGLRAALLL